MRSYHFTMRNDFYGRSAHNRSGLMFLGFAREASFHFARHTFRRPNSSAGGGFRSFGIRVRKEDPVQRLADEGLYLRIDAGR